MRKEEKEKEIKSKGDSDKKCLKSDVELLGLIYYIQPWFFHFTGFLPFRCKGFGLKTLRIM